MMKMIPLAAVMLLSQASFAADKTCLKPAEIDQLRVVSPTAAVATDKHHQTFDIVFIGACGARHPNVHFITKPELMPACVGPNTAFSTNREGPCVVKKITPRS